MATVTWGGRDGTWSFSGHWRPLRLPGVFDTAQFNAGDTSSATIDSAATIDAIQLGGGSVLVQSTLTLLGSLVATGGTIEFAAGGVLSGGTVDLTGATVVANGGVIDGAVWIGDLGRGVTVTAATLFATEVARAGTAMSVVGTLALASGTYSNIDLSMNGFGTDRPNELDVSSGNLVLLDSTSRLVLSQDDPLHTTGSGPTGSALVVSGLGTFGNAGIVISDALAATINTSGFSNSGTIYLDNSLVLGKQAYFVAAGLLTWDQTLAPLLDIASPEFDNQGTIIGNGATLEINGGGFTNSGLIMLGTAAVTGPVPSPQPHLDTISLLSTLEIAATETAFSNTGTLSADTIDIAASVSLSNLGILKGTVIFTGTLDLGGGTLNASTLPSGTRYILKGVVTNGSVVATTGAIDASSATVVNATITTTQSTTLTDILGPGTVTLSASTNELAYTASATVTGLTIDAGAPGSLAKIGLRAGSVTFAADTLISDTVAGTSVTIGGGGMFVENGAINLVGSNLEIATLDGTGTITLSNSAVLTIDSIAASASLTVLFGPGVSALNLPADLTGLNQIGLTLVGLSAGDQLDFTAVSANPGTVFAQPGAAISNGVLQVQGASGDQASVATTATGLTFQAQTDPSGGTYVTVACFRHGTRIATPTGERAVETLRISDMVLTLAGDARPIKWLGHRAYSKQLVAQQNQLRPVRIARGALGLGLPRRRLDLSPLHAVLLGGALVPAAALVNGRTITRAPIAETAYVHVELETPDIIIAEGAPTESFVDCDNRAMFDNTAEFQILYPRDRSPRWTFPVRRIEEGWELEAIRASLAGGVPAPGAPGTLRGHVDVLAQGRIEGWALDADHPATPVELELMVGCRQIACLVANRYRIDLDRAKLGRGACGFSADLPDLDPAALSTVALARLSDGARLIL